jgi:hypothetical protein
LLASDRITPLRFLAIASFLLPPFVRNALRLHLAIPRNGNPSGFALLQELLIFRIRIFLDVISLRRRL